MITRTDLLDLALGKIGHTLIYVANKMSAINLKECTVQHITFLQGVGDSKTIGDAGLVGSCDIILTVQFDRLAIL